MHSIGRDYGAGGLHQALYSCLQALALVLRVRRDTFGIVRTPGCQIWQPQKPEVLGVNYSLERGVN